MKRTLLLALFVLLLAAGSLLAQETTPNFTGQWTLNKRQANLDIFHEGDELNTTDGLEITRLLHTDGEPYPVWTEMGEATPWPPGTRTCWRWCGRTSPPPSS